MKLQEYVNLSQLTTIQLGGPARYLVECSSIEELIEAIEFAETKRLNWIVIGGGSNIVFPDRGYDGLILKMGLRGKVFEGDGNIVHASIAAGESWDDFVKFCVEEELAGVECLSGIPGLVGATPIQNVGAYGQEVSETIEEVTVLECSTKDVLKFSGEECGFGYRTSRFKHVDRGRFIIINVRFALRKFGAPVIKYPELNDLIESGRRETKINLSLVRSAVLALRKKKSMVLDPGDPNSKSVGSFFVNPLLDENQFRTFMERADELGVSEKVPIFAVEGGVKLSAAWLVENAGFHRGFRKGGVGISANHALALVNFGGTASELIGLAQEIQEKVLNIFGIKLEIEPLIFE